MFQMETSFRTQSQQGMMHELGALRSATLPTQMVMVSSGWLSVVTILLHPISTTDPRCHFLLGGHVRTSMTRIFTRMAGEKASDIKQHSQPSVKVACFLGLAGDGCGPRHIPS